MSLIQTPGIPRTAKHYGTLHDVLVFTTRPEDKRLYNFVDGMKAENREQLLAIHEHEGLLYMVWDDDIPEMYYEEEKFAVPGGDEWAVKWNFLGTGHGPKYLGFSPGRWTSSESVVTLQANFQYPDGVILSTLMRYEPLLNDGLMRPVYDFANANYACQNWVSLLKAYRKGMSIARSIYWGVGLEESGPSVAVAP